MREKGGGERGEMRMQTKPALTLLDFPSFSPSSLAVSYRIHPVS